jgi:hypothetical protein
VDGDEIFVVSSDEYINVNNVVYLKEKHYGEYKLGASFFIILTGSIFILVGIVLFGGDLYYSICQENLFKDKFVQHWINTKEFMEAD